MKYWQKDGDSSTAVLKFYGSIMSWWISAKDFTDTLDEIAGKYQNLDIRTHCYGGDVFEGNTMFNAIAQSKLNVTFIIEGVSCSMMSIVMLAGKKIIMAENAFVMIHAPSGYTAGKADDHFSTGKLLKSMQQNFAKAYSRKTGKSVKDCEAWFDGTDHWFSSEECLQMKLADEIISPVGDDQERISKPDPGTAVESIFSKFTALGTEPTPTNQIDNMDKALIISAFGLSSVTKDSSDTAVLQALQAHVQQKDQQIQQLTNAGEAERVNQANAMITARETELQTKFTEDQKKGFVAVAKSSGLEVLTTVLSAMKPAAKLEAVIHPEARQIPGTESGGNSGEERKDWTLDTWAEKDPEGLDALSKSEKPEDKQKFQALYKGKYPGATFE